jgi:hypothetical protein
MREDDAVLDRCRQHRVQYAEDGLDAGAFQLPSTSVDKNTLMWPGASVES